jgi:ADP-heptose:LPS heptosyltransferase
MRMVEITKNFSNNSINYEAGRKFVLAEDTEAQLRTTFGENMGMSYPIESIYRPYKGQDLTGKKLIIFRTGGIGDLHWPIPVLKYLKNKYPTCYIKAASGCKQPLENNPYIDEVHNMPFDAKLMEDCDYHLFFQGILESGSEKSKVTHAVDMFFSYFGIDSIQFPAEEKRPQLFFTNAEVEWKDRELKRLGITDENYVIGIQMETSAPLRNFPKEKFKTVIDTLAKEQNVKIALVGVPAHDLIAGYYKGHYPNILILTKYNVRQTMTMATRYNLIISPDTFMIQTAGALDKPVIGLYGPFPSEVRMKYFKNAIGLDASVKCSPCYKHDFRGCIKGFPSPCWTQITAEDVLQASDYFKFKFTGQHFSYMANFIRTPDLSEVEKYMMSADKGLCFFGGYYIHPNAITVDTNPFVKADIKDLSSEFKKNFYPFILYMNEFNPKNHPTYEGSRDMVRPGGYFIVYKFGAVEQFYTEVKKDIGDHFLIMHSKFDPVTKEVIVVGRKAY